MSTDELRALPQILSLHAEAGSFAAFVNNEIASYNGGVSKYPLCGVALLSASCDQLAIHRAVLDLCKDGWVSLTAVLIRTMIDISLSIAVLVEKEAEAEYRGVKYTHRFLKAAVTEPGHTKVEREDAKTQIQAALKRAPAEIVPKLRHYFYSEPLRAYWFCPEFKSPSDVIGCLVGKDMVNIYNTFSGAAHGGYLGLRFLRDDPDSIHPNPRADPRSQNMALAISTRTLLESTRLRDNFEAAGSSEPINRSIGARLTKVMADPSFSKRATDT